MRTRFQPTLVGALLAALAGWPLAGCEPPPKPGPRTEPVSEHAPPHHRGHARHRHRAEDTERGEAKADVPEKVTKVLRHIDEHRRAPEGYEGGREFHNAGANGEKGLPRRDADGKAITYREWDVNPKVRGVNRGAERLITGSDGSAYYTEDHYRTFTKVR